MLVRAIKEHRTIQFKYKRDNAPLRETQMKWGYSMEELTPDIVKYLDFEPYGLYNSSLWFAVGRIASDDFIHIYALHRIHGIKFLDNHYSVPAGFDIYQYMSGYQLSDDDYDPEINCKWEPDDRFALAHCESHLMSDVKY